ncbi:hypothetical protein BDP27DRAFT_1228169, partial [Rhodocollybia butyracea]
YILDEIDTVLDFLHTQCICHIIRTRFSKAQFIVMSMSLKGGLFYKANIMLFQTEFEDGMSIVEQTANR